MHDSFVVGRNNIYGKKAECILLNVSMMWNFDPGGMEPTSNDLPLMANIKDIRVTHYLLDLKVDLEEKIFAGSVTLFLERPCEHPSTAASDQVCSNNLGNQRSGNLCSTEDLMKFRPVGPNSIVSDDPKLSHCNDRTNKETHSNNVSQNKDALQDSGIFSSSNDKACHTSLQKHSCQTSQLVNCNPAKISENISTDNDSNETLGFKQPESFPFMKESCASSSLLSNENLAENPLFALSSGKQCESEPVKVKHCKNAQENVFELVLDCCDIDILQVEEVSIDSSKSNMKVDASNVSLSKEDLSMESPNESLYSDRNDELVVRTEGHQEPTSSPGCHTIRHSIGDNLGFNPTDVELRRSRFLSCHAMKGSSIDYEVEPWCIRIKKDGVNRASDFPAVVRIRYKTRPQGKSLTWAVDQDGRY